MSTLTQRTNTGYKFGDSFADLLRRFPLWTIKDEEDYDRAMEVFDSLFLRRDLDEDQERYMETLTQLIQAYEEAHYGFDLDSVTPIASLKHLLEANDMTQADLARIIGHQPTASQILSGKRKISVENAKKLGERFKVDFSLFL